MKLPIRILICLSIVLIGGCRDGAATGGRVCSTEARVGIQIEVRDALTGQPAAHGAIAIAHDLTFVDTLRSHPISDSLTVFGVYERSGVYTVIVTKSGYHDWIRSNVVVNKDECHVITVQLDARLDPL